MSKVARKPIIIPDSVKYSIQGQAITFENSGQKLTRSVHESVEIVQEENRLTFKPKSGFENAHAQSGTERSLVNNNLIGVTEGFKQELSIVGVGYRAKLEGTKLVLSLGFSHPVIFSVPDGITIEVPTQTEIVIKGVDKQKVGQCVANICDFRRPDPYKGKGVRIKGAHISLKEGKKK
tara:strand:- start:18096 stop:18629 length:534 start_codon:yes stop_codon:yes gene_type:complete